MEERAQSGDHLQDLGGTDLGVPQRQKPDLCGPAPHLGNSLGMGWMGGVEKGFGVDRGDHGGSFWRVMRRDATLRKAFPHGKPAVRQFIAGEESR
jgi:hypothetical protein